MLVHEIEENISRFKSLCRSRNVYLDRRYQFINVLWSDWDDKFSLWMNGNRVELTEGEFINFLNSGKFTLAIMKARKTK